MRRFFAVILCLSLLLPLFSASVPGHAADSYLITIAEDKVLRSVNDGEIAVYIDGIIYAPYTIFHEMKSVYVNYNASGQMVTVYRVGAVMHFELDTGLTYDYLRQRSIPVSAVVRNGIPYLPVSIVTSWMNMYFSFTSAADSGIGYPIIRLASDKPALSDSVILARNAATLSAVAKTRDRLSGIYEPEPPAPISPAPPPPVPVQPEPPVVVTPEPEIPEVVQPEPVVVTPRRTIALLFTGLPEVLPADETGVVPEPPLPEILSTLESFSLPAAFFLAEEEIVPGAEALRELSARNFSVGILLTDEEDPLAQAQRSAKHYAQVLHTRVRLVCTGDLELTEEQTAALEAEGFVLWEITSEPYSQNTTTSSRLNTAARRTLDNAPTRSTLRLYPNDLTRQSLTVICSYLVAQNFTASEVRDWTQPF